MDRHAKAAPRGGGSGGYSGYLVSCNHVVGSFFRERYSTDPDKLRAPNFKRSPGRLTGGDRKGSIEKLQYLAGCVIRYVERLQDELLAGLLGLEPCRRFLHVRVDEA